MNSKPLTGKFILPAILVLCGSIVLLAWGGRQTQHQPKTSQQIADTVPVKKSDKKIRDLDDVIDELDAAELKVDLDNVKVEIDEAIKKIDMAKVNLEIEKAMKEVDVQKITKEVEKAIKEINFEKIEKEVKASIASVDWAKMDKEMKEAMEEVKKIDMEKVNKEMEQLKIEMKDLGPKIEKEMAHAKVEIAKAKAELKEYKSFVDGLEKDGLIDRKAGYSIRHKDGELFINGKKQPAEVYSKYRSFLEKHDKFSIKKDLDDFDIDMNNDD